MSSVLVVPNLILFLVFIIIFAFYLLWRWVFFATGGPSPVATSSGCSLVTVLGLLTAVVYLVADIGL